MHPVSSPVPAPQTAALSQRLKPLGAFAVLLLLGFAKPLFDLVQFAYHSELFSYILLVPCLSVYLVWTKRNQLPLDSAPDRRLSVPLFLAGGACLAGYWLARRGGWRPQQADYLACMTAAFVLFLAGGCSVFLGRQTLRAVAFPLVFLVFMVPLPESFKGWLETFLQHRSADAAAMLFDLVGTPLLRRGTEFHLPNFALEVAPECSGIHSSVVLFITSLIAAYLLLRANWSRAVLVLCVIPLGILRNGFRIFVLGELCVHVDPGIIDSPLHHRGGPIFFGISIIPFFLLLWLLRRLERRRGDVEALKR